MCAKTLKTECQLYQCDNEVAACVNSCPCFDVCKSGCDGCNTPFCETKVCLDFEEKPDYIDCSDFYENIYYKCVVKADKSSSEAITLRVWSTK